MCVFSKYSADCIVLKLGDSDQPWSSDVLVEGTLKGSLDTLAKIYPGSRARSFCSSQHTHGDTLYHSSTPFAVNINVES